MKSLNYLITRLKQQTRILNGLRRVTSSEIVLSIILFIFFDYLSILGKFLSYSHSFDLKQKIINVS